VVSDFGHQSQSVPLPICESEEPGGFESGRCGLAAQGRECAYCDDIDRWRQVRLAGRIDDIGGLVRHWMSEATKQSSAYFVAPGLLRFARNDGPKMPSVIVQFGCFNTDGRPPYLMRSNMLT
jgi:hypothetical protein